MTARTEVLKAIELMKPQEVLQVADFIAVLQGGRQAAPARKTGPDYLAVRKALSGLKGSLSDDIIKARDDRV